MPWQKERYPTNWPEIARERKELAGWKCEQCGAKHGEVLIGKIHKRPYTVWVAAVHLDHDPENINARLAVFCQGCHLKYDGYLHASNARRRHYQRKREDMLLAGQMPLFEDDCI